MNKKTSYLLVLVLLTACSREVPVSASASNPPPANGAVAQPDNCSSPAPAKGGTGATTADGILAITLIDKPACAQGMAATATAKWDVSSLNVSAVSIYVSSPGNDQKLWVDGHATGQETTGKWVFENTCFVLQNKDTGSVLAARLISTIPCER